MAWILLYPYFMKQTPTIETNMTTPPKTLSSIFVLWIDLKQAKIFQFSDEKMERRNLEASHTDHHTHRSDNLDRQQHERAFFVHLAEALKDASQLLILGPGVVKHHFQSFLIEHCPVLAKRVVGCETVDHPTDPQIAALARKFFNVPIPAASGIASED